MVFLLTIIIVYIPAIRAGYIWDDDRYVTGNELLASIDGLGRTWFEIGATVQYYPLVFTTFWLEYHLWELNPAGYHLINVLLHACGAWILFLVLRRLCVPGAFVAAAVFALHPVQVESVAWITERKNVLSGVFYLSSLLLYLRFVGFGEEHVVPARRWRFYAGALLLYGCALLSKTVTCSLPAAIVLLLWWKRKRLSWTMIVPLVPMFAVGLLFGLTTAWVEREFVGARGETWSLSAMSRVLIAGRALWFYAGKLIWPFHLSFNYERWDVNSAVWWQYLYPCLAVVLVVGLWRLRRATGKGPLVAVLLFGGTLLPALGFIDLYPMRYSFVADHFQYLASGSLTTLFVAMIAFGLARILRAASRSRKPVARPSRAPHTICAVVVLTGLAILTWRQAGVYHNQETLWNHTLAENPKSWIAHNNLGVFLEAKGRKEESFNHYVSALELKPDFVLANKNLGVLLMRRGRLWEAEAHLRRAIDFAPDYGDAYGQLGICLAKQGKTSEAIVLLNKSVELRPTDAAVYNNLGWTLAGSKKFDEAILAYRKALEMDPASADAHYNMGTALVSLGRFQEAISPLAHAVRIKPDYADAYYNMGHVYFQLGRRQEAIDNYQAALRIDSRHRLAKRALQALRSTP